MSPMRDGLSVTPVELLIRSFAEKKGDQWQAFSLEFGLAAQGDTLDEVCAKLDSMIACYLEDALGGEDRARAEALLSRKCTMNVWFKYHIYSLLSKFRKEQSLGSPKIFREALPLAPLPC